MADRCTSGVFKIAVQIAEAESERVAGEVDGPKKQGREEKHQRPKSEDQTGLRQDFLCPTNFEGLATMVSQMSIAPHGLRNPEQETDVERVNTIRRGRFEEWQV